MSDYNVIPGIDSFKRFPPSVREALASMAEMLSKFAHLSEDNELVIAGEPVGQPSPAAGMNTVGWAQAVFIPNEGTLPPDLPDYCIVIESE